MTYFKVSKVLLLSVVVGLLSSVGASAQSKKRDHLTEQEVEQVRDVQQIDQRIEVFIKSRRPAHFGTDHSERYAKEERRRGLGAVADRHQAGIADRLQKDSGRSRRKAGRFFQPRTEKRFAEKGSAKIQTSRQQTNHSASCIGRATYRQERTARFGRSHRRS